MTPLLPPLREELRLLPAAANGDGSPAWMIHDPVCNRFFRIDWPTFLILSHWHAGSPAQVAAEASSHAPMALDSQDVEAVLDFLGRSELLQCTTAMDTRRLDLAARGRRRSAGSWLLHHYLFFRVPLWRHDPWLQRAAPLVAPFFSRHFAYLSLLALVLGILGVSRQWEHFRHTLVGSLDWNGAKAYLAVLIGVKILHEFGHALGMIRMDGFENRRADQKQLRFHLRATTSVQMRASSIRRRAPAYMKARVSPAKPSPLPPALVERFPWLEEPPT